MTSASPHEGYPQDVLEEKIPSLPPLSTLKVLDFSSSLPGPMASLMLREAGAEVIKIEKPGEGEPLRQTLPLWGHSHPTFSMLNRGKLSLALDLKDVGQRKWLEPLLKEADVVLEQFRPGVMTRLGLDYESVRELNPRIIYCSLTGYGQTGPKAQKSGHDLNYISETGLLSLSVGDVRRPTLPPLLASSFAGGAYPVVINILLALLQRQKTGVGGYLDLSMTDHLFALSSWAIAEGLGGEGWPKSGKGRFTGGTPRYQLYPTQDGRILAVAALEDHFWSCFCDVIGLPEIFRADGQDPQGTYSAIRKILLERTAQEWVTLFEGKDCCVSLVLSLEEAMKDPHYHARGVFDPTLENEYGDTLPAIPVPIAAHFRAPPGEYLSAPALGGHNDMLLKKG